MDQVKAEMPAHVTVFGLDAQQIVPIRWEYNRADPYAVRLIAPGHFPGDETVWIFSRGILTDALNDDTNEPVSGPGDVKASADATDLVVYLSSPEGEAALIFERDAMENFVNASYGVVPAQGADIQLGEELDTFLSDVLGYTPTEVVDDTTPLDGPTKELHFPMSGLTYTVPEDSPADLAEWEAELLHGIYSDQPAEEKRDETTGDTEQGITEE